MKTAVVTLRSVSPYSQSKHYDVPKLDMEPPKKYEERTWRERMHVNKEGNVIIPPMSFKNCLSEVAGFLSKTVPGKRSATYTKHFEAGILCPKEVVLPFKKDEVPGEWLFVPSDGKRGGGKRVDKCFPVIQEWSADVEFIILDDTITKEVFVEHLTQAGKFIGIGRFRPRRNGFYGRFEVVKVKWLDA
jgi:hypothetical protein